MKVKKFNNWSDKEDFNLCIIPELVIGRVPAGWGCSKIFYIIIGWLFWSWQISFGGCYQNKKEE